MFHEHAPGRHEGRGRPAHAAAPLCVVLLTASPLGCSDTELPDARANPRPDVIALAVEAGEVVRGPETATVEHGGTVILKVTTDIPDEVHVHGYNLSRHVSPGDPAVLEFNADIPGQFDVELEHTHLTLFALQVES